MSKIRRFMHAVTGSVAALVIAVAIPGGHAYLAGPESLAGSVQDETDAEYLAAFLAQCNDIVKEEFKYQPGADLSQKEVLGIYFTVYSHMGAKEKLIFF